MKLRSSKLIINRDVEKQMVEYDFGHRLHDLNYFEVRFIPSTHYVLRESSPKFV